MNDTFSQSSLKATIHSFSLQAQCLVMLSLENVSLTLAAKKRPQQKAYGLL